MGNTHLITGYAGTEHIMSADQGSFNASFFGTGEYVMEAGSQLEASITNNNNVRILDGDILMQGRHIRIKPNTYEDVNITTGTAGVDRNDLIVCEYAKNANTGVETAEIKVIMGTASESNPSDPAYTSGNIFEGAALNQMPLYRVKIRGVVLSSIEPIFSTLTSFGGLAEQYEQEFITACTNHLNSLNVLDSMEEIEANMQSNQLAGALALKEGLNAINAINEFEVLSSGWAANTDSSTSDLYPYTQTIETDEYTEDSTCDCYIMGADSSALMTSDEKDQMGNIDPQVIFTSEGIQLFATDEVTVDFTLRVKGV